LTAIDIVGLERIVVVQTKIDLVSKEQALANYKQIKEFLKGTVAESAPIVPISAMKRINLNVLLETIENVMKSPKRDPKKIPKFLVARSFDVNKPGTKIEKLKGGVIGGSLMQGKLKVGDDIEIKPGVKVKEKFESVSTKITGLQKAGKDLKEIDPGGLIGISTTLDPYLTKSDSLSGSVTSLTGKLPPATENVKLKTNLLKRVVGMKEGLNVGEIKTGDVLMLTSGTMRTTGSVTSGRSGEIDIHLKSPVCADKGERIAISKLFSRRWRLIGYGEII
jgi:translation initiation factor 2 subunit 3